MEIVKVKSESELTAQIEPFDSFWEAPDDIEKGYKTFSQFYKHNYLSYIPKIKNANILVISCGFGYFLNLLSKSGYTNVIGIDSCSEKVNYARERNLNCKTADAFNFLKNNREPFDVIFCEQELNHLTKAEILEFLKLCWNNLEEEGILLAHSLNGANPITGAEALAQNFDHYNTFTEYTMKQILEHSKFSDVKVFPLNLYVFYANPLNYLLIALSALYTMFFRFSFILYGKKNKIFTKKIGVVCKKDS